MVFLFVLAFVIAAGAEFIRFRMEADRESDHGALIDPHLGTVIMLPDSAQAI